MAGTPPRVEVIAAAPEDRPVVERLAQLYEYDVSDLTGYDVDTDGLYRYMDGDVIWQPGWHIFLVRVDGQLAGFAFVTRHASYLGDGDTTYMDEFFVMRKYRRRGVGEQVARMLFDRFPGRWEVSELRENTPAQAFWRRVIGRHTGGSFREAELDDARWRGPVQAFESRGATTER